MTKHILYFDDGIKKIQMTEKCEKHMHHTIWMKIRKKSVWNEFNYIKSLEGILSKDYDEIFSFGHHVSFKSSNQIQKVWKFIWITF